MRLNAFSIRFPVTVIFMSISVIFADQHIITRQHQNLTCKRGQAVSKIEWTNINSGYKVFKIDCVNFTSSCTENCEWTTACTIEAHGKDVYLQGIDVLYNPFKDIQSYILFLCCNATGKQPAQRQCNGTMAKIAHGIQNRDGVSIRQTNASMPFTGENLFWETCTQEVENVTLCPPAPPGGVLPKPPPLNPKLYGLEGLNGLLGLLGLALIKKRQTTTTTTTTTTATTKPPYTCNPGNVCGGDNGLQIAVYDEPTDTDTCFSYCLNTPGCVGFDSFGPGLDCYLWDVCTPAPDPDYTACLVQ